MWRATTAPTRGRNFTGSTFILSDSPVLLSRECMAPSLAALHVPSTKAPWVCLARLLGAGCTSFMLRFTSCSPEGTGEAPTMSCHNKRKQCPMMSST